MNDLIERLRLGDGTSPDHELLLEAADALEALAQPEQDSTYTYASSLATTIWQKHYIKESPKFALLDTTEGVLTQIDNMTCGLVREKSAQPEQEPVGQLLEDAFGRGQVMWFNKPKDELMLYTTPQSEKYPQIAINPEIVGYVAPQRTWVGLTDEEIKAFDTWHDNREEEVGWCNPSEIVAYIEAKLKEKNT